MMETNMSVDCVGLFFSGVLRGHPLKKDCIVFHACASDINIVVIVVGYLYDYSKAGVLGGAQTEGAGIQSGLRRRSLPVMGYEIIRVFCAVVVVIVKIIIA